MATHPSKEWRSILAAVFIIGIIAGANFWGNVSADNHGGAGDDGDGPGRSAQARTVHPPQNTAEREVIEVEGGAVDVTGGVSIGANVPGATPGTPSQPVPNFSAINTPVWVSSQGPAQIVDDLIVYGLTEVKGGLINNGDVAPPGGGGGGGGGAPPLPPVSTPELTIELDPSSPAGRQISRQEGNVTIMKIKLTASHEDVVVSGMKISLVGDAIPGGIENIKLFDGDAPAPPIGGPITPVYDTVFTGLNLNIPAGGSKIIRITIDMAESASDYAWFIPGVYEVTTLNAGTFSENIVGNEFEVAPTALLYVELDPSSPAGGIIQHNSTAVPVVKIKLTAFHKDAVVSGMKIAMVGSMMPANFANVGIYDGDVQLGNSSSASDFDENKKVTFSGFALRVLPGASKIITVKTDFLGGSVASTFKFGVQNVSTDVVSSTRVTGPLEETMGNIFMLPPYIVFDRDSYNIESNVTAEEMKVTVTSAAANRDSYQKETITATVSYGEQTINASLVETDLNTAIFTKSIILKSSNAIASEELLANCATNTLTATYQATDPLPQATANATAAVTGPPCAPPRAGEGEKQKITFIRINTPAANSALSFGGEATLLEFTAQTSTRNADLKKLFVVPKTNRSEKITDLKLRDAAGTLLATGYYSKVVNNQKAYVFDMSSAPQRIETVAVKFKITGNVSCGTGSVEDHIIETPGSAIFVVKPDGGIEGLPFTPSVPRTLTACPPPAAPTVKAQCLRNSSVVQVKWTNPNGKGDQGYYIDLDQVDNIKNAFSDKTGVNDFINTNRIASATTTAIIPSGKSTDATALTYSDVKKGNKGTSVTTLTPGKKYYARMYYVGAKEHSQLTSFTATACDASDAADAVGAAAAGGAAGGGATDNIYYTIPGGGGATVKNSILNFSDGSFPHRSAAEQNKPVTLFGSFIPPAYAQVQVLPPPPTALHPVYIFDDLYVYGSGATGPEPGNLFVKGGIFTEGNSNIGAVGSITQFTGDVSITGGTLSVGTLNVNGNLAVSNNVNITGNATAAAFGAFYRKENSASSVIENTMFSASVSCETGDILISCSGSVRGEVVPRYEGAKASQTQCSAFGRRMAATNANTSTVEAQGVCFSPNGLPAGQTNIPVP